MSPIPSSPSTTAFRIRPARRGDAEPLRALMAELRLSIDAALVTWVISHPEMELLVAADSMDKPVGMLAFSHRPQLREGGRCASIDEVVVASGWRRKGVGRALLKKAIERATVLGVKKLVGTTLGGTLDETAVAFFQSCGFRTSAEQRVWFEGFSPKA